MNIIDYIYVTAEPGTDIQARVGLSLNGRKADILLTPEQCELLLSKMKIELNFIIGEHPHTILDLLDSQDE